MTYVDIVILALVLFTMIYFVRKRIQARKVGKTACSCCPYANKGCGSTSCHF